MQSHFCLEVSSNAMRIREDSELLTGCRWRSDVFCGAIGGGNRSSVRIASRVPCVSLLRID